jgi:hypothetical protein
MAIDLQRGHLAIAARRERQQEQEQDEPHTTHVPLRSRFL